MSEPTLPRIDRRAAMKWMLAAAGTAWLSVHGQGAGPASSALGTTRSTTGGYGLDPNLVKSYHPGDFWPLTFTAEQRRLAAALCDVVIPADEFSPSASAVGAHDFIDEWISAPYLAHGADRKLVLEGFSWIEAQADKSFGKRFADLGDAPRRQICDEICFLPNATPAFAEPARFFARWRDLVSGGFYTTPEGMKDIGYRGNQASGTFEGPPPEVLRKVGLA